MIVEETEVSADPAVESEARQLGWVPQEQFKGNPEKWVPADQFVRRGKEIMPILKKNNEKLLTEIREAKTDNQELKEVVRQQTQTIEEFKRFQAQEIKRQVEAKMKQLRREKTEAIKAGDHDTAAEIEEEIDELRDSSAAPPPPAPTPPPPANSPKIEPWAKAFYDENKEWLDDPRHSALLMTEAEILYKSEGLRETALVEKAKKNVEAFLGTSKRPGASKVEGGNRSADGGGGTPRKKGFSDLPSDAKAVCRQEESKFVGEGKAFKTAAEWHEFYARTYLGEE